MAPDLSRSACMTSSLSGLVCSSSVKRMPIRAAPTTTPARSSQGTFALSLSSAVLRKLIGPASDGEAAAERPRVTRQAVVHRAEIVGEHPDVRATRLAVGLVDHVLQVGA